MPAPVSKDPVLTTLGKAAITDHDEPVAQFGKCKMCSCPRYTTTSNDWQFCDCGHSRSQHQH
jgi:hypothetical protein